MSDKLIELPASFEVQQVGVEDSRPPHVLICIHGIRDDGAWCDTTAVALGEFLNSNVEIVCVRYDRVSSWRLLIGHDRSEIRRDILQQIAHIVSKYPGSPISILCHSYGTKVVAELIANADTQFEWVFLSGSVCHILDVNELRTVLRQPVNDAGTRDWWPILAEAIRPFEFNATGACGFNRFPVIDRYHPYKHGGGITRQHIEQWILPILSTGRVQRIAPPPANRYKKHVATYGRYTLYLFAMAIAAALLV